MFTFPHPVAKYLLTETMKSFCCRLLKGTVFGVDCVT